MRSDYDLDTPRDDPDWRARAACQVNPDLFFSVADTGAGRARHVCLRHCPVLHECLAEAEISSPSGCVQGGLVWAYDKHVGKGRPSRKQPLVAEHGDHCYPIDKPWRVGK